MNLSNLVRLLPNYKFSQTDSERKAKSKNSVPLGAGFKRQECLLFLLFHEVLPFVEYYHVYYQSM